MMDSNKSVSLAARFPSAVLPVQWSTTQNTCKCLKQNFSQRWTGNPYSHWTLPYDYFLLCTTHRQNMVQEKYRIMTEWKGICYWLTWKIWAKEVVGNHSTEFHTTMFTYEA
jgi:hypothetical protein